MFCPTWVNMSKTVAIDSAGMPRPLASKSAGKACKVLSNSRCAGKLADCTTATGVPGAMPPASKPAWMAATRATPM